MSAVPLPKLAAMIACKLEAVPHPLPPARAVFAGGMIVLGEKEIAVCFEGIGAFFISYAEDVLVIEAGAFNDGEPRDVVLDRHDKLERLSRALFGDNIERRDPLGLRGGARAAVS